MRFGGWGFAVLVFGLLVRVVLDTLLSNILRPLDFGAHGVSALALLGLWASVRGERQRTRTTLAVLDLIAMNTVTLGFCAMVMSLPLVAHPMLVLLLALTFIFGLRATYVPSARRQTVLIHATAMIWLLITATYTAERYREAGLEGPDASTFSQLISASIWWIFNSGAAIAATGVIYGLRREVREAMQLGQYTLGAKLGEGGMGAVYRAQHAMLRRPTAVKLLPPAKTGARAIERFEREVQRTASLSHPNVVTVFDYGRTPDGVFYYAMEHLDGLDLQELVRVHGPMDPGRAVHVLTQICEGLAEAHEVGLIHRDVKPANVFLIRSGRSADLAKIVDFGLVKEVKQADDPATSYETRIVGTPQCMSPEAITSPEAVDERSDLYAVGAVGYYLLAGRDVFEGPTLVDVVGKHLHQAPPPLEVSGVPQGLEEILLWCLAKDPGDRPSSAAELGDLLASLEDVRPWTLARAKEWWSTVDEGPAEPASERTPSVLSLDLRSRR